VLLISVNIQKVKVNKNNLKQFIMRKITQSSTPILAVVLLSMGFTSQLFAAYNTIDRTLDLGNSNADVIDLQSFLKDNSAIYPEGLVTGYYGTLTQAAVQRFQSQNGLVSSGTAATTGYGRVGPLTRNAINARISAGGWSGGTSTPANDMSGPAIFSVGQSIGTTSATFTWSTNESATAKVFYNTSPISMNEGDINSSGFGSTNGFSVTNDGMLRTSQQVTVSGLRPNTRYYYVIVATDARGNVSVFGPNNTFVTPAM
jgi:peptidoglycan hydrolase-like protein with peptidoglycan-binding domain